MKYFWKGLRQSIRLKVSLLILVPVLLALLISTALEYRRQTDRELNSMSLQASQTGRVVEQALVHDMLESDTEGIQAILDSIWEDNQFRALYILDRTGEVIFAPTGVSPGLRLDNEEESCQPCHSLPPNERPSGIVVNNSFGERVFRSMNPIVIRPECTACHEQENEIIGLLLTDISVAPVEKAVLANTRSSLIWWVTALLATAILANLAINKFVLNRLGTLTTAIRNFNPQDPFPILPDASNDEIGRLSVAFNDMSKRLAEHEEKKQSLTKALDARNEERGALLKRLINAQEEERKRLAREIHDELGQSLSSIGLNVELVQNALLKQPEAAGDYLQRVNELVSNTTEHMYNLILGLRPSALDDLGLGAALRAHAQRTLAPSGIEYELKIDSQLDRLSPQLETVLFRLFQEAITNIVRHAKANHVKLGLSLKNGTIEGSIIDDGAGFEPQQQGRDLHNDHGYGLLGMKERVEQFGGELQIESHPGEGTQLMIRLPIESV